MMGFLTFDMKEKRRRSAAKWLARMKGPRAGEFREAFERWRAEPANAEAYARVSATFNWAALLRFDRPSSTTILPTSDRRPRRVALAAFLALVLALPAAIIVSGSMPFPWGSQATLMYSTRVGEIRTVELADGSSLTLDSDTTAEIRNGNEVELLQGRLRVSRPAGNSATLIKAAGYTAMARQGIFDASRIEGTPTFTCVAGELLVSGGSMRNPGWLKVGAGHAVAQAAAGHRLIKAQGTAWPEGMLQFDDQSLDAAIALANRYTKVRIRLADPELAGLRVTGGFQSGDNKALASSLAQAFGLRLEARANRELWLHPAEENIFGG